ncbi:MAG TPA: methyl-accepting chemotaxis protein [Rhodocyclaceae bacterium]|nr:methyl-accepting chemotaxis protein [Rhodocyclaceae bacterium]
MKLDILAPGRAVVNRFRFGTKFVIVGLLLLLPFATLFYAHWHRVNADIEMARQERAGLQLIAPAMSFMQAVQFHRRYTRDVLTGMPQASASQADARTRADEALDAWAAVNALHGEALGVGQAHADIRTQWGSIKNVPANTPVAASMGEHGRLIEALQAYLVLVSDSSGLTMDPESQGYFLQELITRRVPEAADSLRLLRAAAVQAARNKQMTLEERVLMQMRVEEAEAAYAALQSGVSKALRDNPALQTRLIPAINQLRDRQTLFLNTVKSDIFGARRVQADPATLSSLGNETAAALYLLLDTALPAMDNLLSERIERRQTQLRNEMLASLVCMLLAFYLFAALRNSVARQVGDLRKAVEAIATGDFSHAVHARSNDEIGEFADALDRVRGALGERIAREQTLSEHMLRVKIALDNAGTPFRIADQSGTVVYANPKMFDVLRSIESEMKAANPNFSVDGFVGSNIGDLMGDRESYMKRLEQLKSLTVSEWEIGGRIFNVTAAPVFDDKGVRLGTVGEWLDRTEQVAIERELAAIVNAAAEGDFSRRVDLVGKSGFFLNLGQGLNQLLESSERGLHAVASVLQSLARGDLTQRLEGNYQGLFARLQNDANATVESLSELVLEIREVSEMVNTAAREIAAGNADLSSRTEEQASSLEETASSMEELSATVRQNADSARQANALAANSNTLASQGGEMVQRVIGNMSDIQEGSKRIADIVGVIDAIAFQTNILALNAAVEAARAGEQGRGFAVVASEVRSLAQRSATAAKEIRELIVSSVGRVEDGVHLVREAGGTMTNVVSSFSEVARLVTDITGASREQSSGIDQVTRAVTQMDEVTQQNAALVEEAAAAAESLEDQARGLVELVSRFRLEGDELRSLSVAMERPILRDATPRRLARGKSAPRLDARSFQTPPNSPEDEWQEF